VILLRNDFQHGLWQLDMAILKIVIGISNISCQLMSKFVVLAVSWS
jgi:hypothetical protein